MASATSTATLQEVAGTDPDDPGHDPEPGRRPGPGRAADPFDGLVLDETFVRGAWKYEPTADVRIDRATTARANWEAAQHHPQHPPRQGRPPGVVDTVRSRRLRPLLPALLALTLVVAAGTWTGRLGPRAADAAWQSGQPQLSTASPLDQPTPRAATSPEPLGTPPALTETGPHRFVATQPDTAEPVTYDPCRPIPVVISARTAPADGDALVREALDIIGTATGLSFVVEGPTDEASSTERPAFQPGRYGDRWAPVLIAWSDPGETLQLAGNVSGLGGSILVHSAEHPDTYVTGLVTLDGPQLAEIASRPGGRDQVLSTIVHELAHLVGLDHVDDPSQLMHPHGRSSVTTLQAGDRAGLARLGQGPCLPEL